MDDDNNAHDGSKSESHAAKLSANFKIRDVDMDDEQTGKNKLSKSKLLFDKDDENSNDHDLNIEKDYTETIERYRKSYNAQKNQQQLQQSQKEKEKHLCSSNGSDRSRHGVKGKAYITTQRRMITSCQVSHQITWLI